MMYGNHARLIASDNTAGLVSRLCLPHHRRHRACIKPLYPTGPPVTAALPGVHGDRPQHDSPSPATRSQSCSSRRSMLTAVAISPAASLLGTAVAAAASAASSSIAVETAAPVDSAASAPAEGSASTSTALVQEAFQEVDFQLYPPAGFNVIDTNPQRSLDARGPTPERSPIRARFESPTGATVSVLVRSAQVIKALLTQVTDISQYGSLDDVEKLVVPRGVKMIKASAAQVRLPPRKTNLGDLEPPPQNYYRYEFLTPNKVHVFMSVAAQRGRVYICGGSAAEGSAWDDTQAGLRASVESFRVITYFIRI